MIHENDPEQSDCHKGIIDTILFLMMVIYVTYIFIDSLTDLLQKIESVNDLEEIAHTLQNKFYELTIAIKDSLEKKGVSLNNVKLLIDQKLKHKIRTDEEKGMEKYRKKLHELKNMDELFHFLHEHDFFGYLNYVLLKQISNLTNDKIILNKFEEYEESYVKLISKATFRDIMSVFRQNPALKPAAPIGLPKIVFHLEDLWQDKTFLDWIRSCLWGFSGFELCLLKELKKNCVIITYAVFPSAFPDILEYFNSPAIQQKFQKIRVTVELPEMLG